MKRATERQFHRRPRGLACTLALLAGGLFASATQGRRSPGAAPALSGVTVVASDRQVNVGAGETVTLVTQLPVPALETVVIADLAGSVVRTIVHQRRAPGTYADAWDGKGEGNRRLKDDQYRWVATFEDGAQLMTIDQSGELDGDFEVKSHFEYGSWNAFENTPLRFSYAFDRPSKIALVFSRETFHVLPACDPPKFFCRFLDGWQPAGEFAYEWAGVDDAGALRPDLHAIFVIAHHENLSKNAIVVYGGRPRVSAVAVSPPRFRPDDGPQTVTFSLQTCEEERVFGTVAWRSQKSGSVLRTMRISDLAPGLVTAEWDGRADNGMRVAPGRYTISVKVVDALGQEARGEILTTVEY